MQSAATREQFDYSKAAPTRRKALHQGLSRPMPRRGGANPDSRHCIKDGGFVDPASGTGGFLVEAYNHLAVQVKTVADRTVRGNTSGWTPRSAVTAIFWTPCPKG
jgi:hypothetical protein